MSVFKKILLLLLVVAAVIGYILVDHDAGLYRDMTVVKITDISTKHTETQTGVLSDKENYYVQTITANILNGEYKGKTATLSNQYTDSNVRDEAYAVGDQLLVDLARDGTTGKILEQKRDTLVYLFVAVLLIGLIAVAGFFSFLSVCINLVLLLFALHCYLTGWNIMALTACMIFLFTVLSLLIGNGVNRRSLLAIVVTLFSIAVTAVFTCWCAW